MLSGYDTPVYATLKSWGWVRADFPVRSTAAPGNNNQRLEWVWLNPAAQRAPLFMYEHAVKQLKERTK